MRRSWALVVCLMVGLEAEARYRAKPIPLTPEREFSYAGKSTDTTTKVRPVASASRWLGTSLGVVGQGTNVPGNTLGLHLLFGGVFYYRFPISPHLFLKPTLGFYTRGTGGGIVDVAQHLIETGLSVLYVPSLETKLRSQLGLTLKGDITFSHIAVADTVGSSSAVLFRVRPGLTFGIAYSFSPELSGVADLEFTAPIQALFRPYLTLGTGLMLRW